MAQSSHLGGDLVSLPESVGVVQLSINPAYDARMIASGLEAAAALLGRRLTAQVVESRYFREVEDALRGPYELADRLDRPGAVEELASDLKRRLTDSVGALLFPPILGHRGTSLATRLSGLLGRPCAEILSSPPSVPGLRLQEALDAALIRAGVPIVESEVALLAPDSRSFAIQGGSIEATAVVLATGKFIGGGVVRHERFKEPIFDLPLFAGGTRAEDQYIGDLLADTFQGEHQVFRVGVRIDSSLHPLDLRGQPMDPQLFAAGSVISGYDPAADKTGLGVAIFTGYLAGEAASRVSLAGSRRR
jgi:glycerol-3-phosphate dehydrogenase subunit B